MILTCHTAFYSPSSIYEIRLKSAQTMRDVVSLHFISSLLVMLLAELRYVSFFLQLIDGIQSNIIHPDME